MGTDKNFNDIIPEAENWMNTYIAPHDFAGIVMMEEEHPLMEREAENGLRNVIVYHTCAELKPLKNEDTEFDSIIYSFSLIEKSEDKNWNGIYDDVIENIQEG